MACCSISCHALAVSAKAWHVILHLVIPWLLRLGSIRQGLSFSKAWHAILYLISPWQYLPRLGMLFYILSCLGSICLGLALCNTLLFYILLRLGSISRGLTSYSISCQSHTLAVSAEAWHAILYLITPWQYLPRLGMLFCKLSRLGSISRRTNLQKPKLRKLNLKEQSQTTKVQAPKTRATKAQVEQRHAGVLSERYLVDMLRRLYI